MLIHHSDSGETFALDYREKAPAKAERDLFLGPDGELDKVKARFSHLSVGVPGTVAGLIEAHRQIDTLEAREGDALSVHPTRVLFYWPLGAFFAGTLALLALSAGRERQWGSGLGARLQSLRAAAGESAAGRVSTC
mgnify:CR=1 FL=1